MSYDNYRLRELPSFRPAELPPPSAPAGGVGDATGVGGPSDVGGATALEESRPLESRVAAWTERTDAAPLGTGTSGVAADRTAVRGLGAPGVTARGDGSPIALDDGLLRDIARTRTTGIGGDRILLAQVTPRSTGDTATDAPTGIQLPSRGGATAQPLQTGTTVPTGGPTATAAPTIVAPTGPVLAPDLARMDALNTRIQNFDVARSPVPEAELRATQAHMQAATDALHRGDYATANRELAAMGLPPSTPANPATGTTAIMLGASTATGTRGGAWQSTPYNFGARGNQQLNDAIGFAANARMMTDMRAAGANPHNPPTEAECVDYMQRISRPTGTPPVAPSAASISAAANRVVDGMVMHYSSAGRTDPQYGANPNPRIMYTPPGRGATPQIFDTEADARAAATAAGDRHPRLTRLATQSPDEWADVGRIGTRSGRSVGDCESKLYLQQRLLTAAGFTSLGSVDVQHRGGIGHMFGAFRAPGGEVFVTSNEASRQVTGTGPRTGPGGTGPASVTQADLDATLRDMTADVYNVRPNAAGVRDTSGFRFSSSATRSPAGAAEAVDSIRRSSENGIAHRTDRLLP